MLLLILIVLVIFAVASMPTYGYSRNWGYGPTGLLWVILLVVLLLYLTGNLHLSM